MATERVSLNDEEQSIIRSAEEDDSLESKEWFKECRVYYTLPTIRLTIVTSLLLLCDLIVCNTLWLTGGIVTSSVLDYQFSTSVFDIAMISIFKWLAVSMLLLNAESRTLTAVSTFRRVSRSAVIVALLLCLASFVVVMTKGIMVLVNYSAISRSPLPGTYYACLIVSITLALIESLLVIAVCVYLPHISKKAIKHIVNKNNVELDTDGNAIKQKASLKRLIKIAKPELPLILVGCFCLLITSGAGIVAPLFFGEVVDAAQTSMAKLNQTVIILFLIYCAYGVAGFFRSWFFELAGQRLVARLRVILFTALIRQDIEFFDVTRTGEVTNRLSSDTQVIQSAITVNISMLLRNFITIIGSLVVMFALNPALTGIMLAVVPVISLSAVQYGKFMKKLRKNFQDRLADAGTVAEECISSMRTVRAFNGDKKAVADYDREIMKSYAVAKKIAFGTGVFSGWVSIAAFGAICLAMWYGGKLVFEQQLSVGTLTSFLVYTVSIAGGLAVISSLYGEFMQAVGASDRMFEILDQEPKVVVSDSCREEPCEFTPAVEFSDVHFTYPSRPDYEVLKGVTLSIQPGKVVALVGPSGGGKSTVVSLIERFYDCNSGEIYLSGISIRHLDPLWFRTKMSLVNQEPTLFACSIKDNIAYGTNATDEQVIEAAKQSNSHNFIAQFPDGYDTLVGERGVRLSGGQKQRVAIARSLITNPAILLLDEATSALDAESEQLVQEAIDRAMKGRTVLIIAHRLSTVRNSDQVVVIDKGVIAEQGTHDELVASNGVYKRLVLKQLEAGNQQTLAESD
ncbi:uncharacterized protein [Watersipora subatra]|uniref:uncharacterized protein n=1 Tax=Watersipora subatra TaxID=2589382 RepID=UPI00355BFCAF